MTSDEETRPLIVPVPQWDKYKGVQLYDLSVDPYETTDISTHKRELVNELAAELRNKMLNPTDALPQIGAIVYNFKTVINAYRILLAVSFTILPLFISMFMLLCYLRSKSTPKRKID